MRNRTDAIYLLSHVADAFRGQRDTVVIEAEEAVLIVQDAEAEIERLRSGHALATGAADAAAEAVAAMAVKMRAAVAENLRLRSLSDLVLANRDDILASIRYSAMQYEHSKRPGVAKDLSLLAVRLEKAIRPLDQQEAT